MLSCVLQTSKICSPTKIPFASVWLFLFQIPSPHGAAGRGDSGTTVPRAWYPSPTEKPSFFFESTWFFPKSATSNHCERTDLSGLLRGD